MTEISVAFPNFSVRCSLTETEITHIAYARPEPERLLDFGLAGECIRQLKAFQNDAHYRMELPLRPAGTPYQRRVWSAISELQAGETTTYGELAKRLHSGPRAVGNACGANPYPLAVPCHRVVGANGLGGFGGVGSPETPRDFLLSVKRWLLAHDQS